MRSSVTVMRVLLVLLSWSSWSKSLLSVSAFQVCRSAVGISRRTSNGPRRYCYYYRSDTGTAAIGTTIATATTTITTTTSTTTTLSAKKNNYGRQEFWNDLYEQQSNFSWYAGWDDLRPFVEDFIGTATGADAADAGEKNKSVEILLPGVGNDATLVDMYDDGRGYNHITALDYAPEAIERCREMLQQRKQHRSASVVAAAADSDVDDSDIPNGIRLCVADARDLTGILEDNTFDLILEKGTLDAIYLSGGENKTLAFENMDLAVTELGRCVKPGSIWISLAGVVPDEIQRAMDGREEWKCRVHKDDLYISKRWLHKQQFGWDANGLAES
jgi:Methyltransferase domain